MPIYEYLCQHCHHNFDVLQKVSDPDVQDCPKCGETAVTRLVSAAGFQLKGTGWYVTDFKNKDKPKNASTPIEKDKTQATPPQPTAQSGEKA